MGYLKPQETDVLKMPSNPDYWVRFRKRAPWGIRIGAQGKMIKVSAAQAAANGHKGKRGGLKVNGPNGQVEMISEAEWAGYIRALVFGFITAWNLTDENDEPLELCEESLDELVDEDGTFLANEAQARSKLRGVEEERNFETPSPPRSSKVRR